MEIDPFSPSLVCAGCGAALARVVLLSANHLAVNLKAEFEICHLHEKLRHLIHWQWVRLAEIQQIQLEIMEDLARAKDDAAPGLITKFWAPLPRGRHAAQRTRSPSFGALLVSQTQDISDHIVQVRRIDHQIGHGRMAGH